jgi:hypothetical protein
VSEVVGLVGLWACGLVGLWVDRWMDGWMADGDTGGSGMMG